MTYHPLNGRGYGHVTVFKILPFAVTQVTQRVARFCERQLSYLLYSPQKCNDNSTKATK